MNDPLDKTYSVLIFSIYVLEGNVPERLELGGPEFKWLPDR